MNRIDLTPEQLAIVQSLLREHLTADAKVWVFGSRAIGRTRRASDLDLAIDIGRALRLNETSVLIEAFDEAPLPFSVDIVDLNTVNTTFRVIIERDRVPLPGFMPA